MTMAFFGFGKKKEETRQEQESLHQSAPGAAETAQPAEDEQKKGIFSRLWQGLSKTRTNVAGRVDELIEATEDIDEDFYEDLVDILIMSDMGVRTSDKVIAELRRRIEQQRITDARKAREILKQILKEIMTMERKPLRWPMIMMVVGVNGVIPSFWLLRIPSALPPPISCRSGPSARRCRLCATARAQTRLPSCLTAFRRRRPPRRIC